VVGDRRLLISGLPRASGCEREVIEQQISISILVVWSRAFFGMRDFYHCASVRDFLHILCKYHKIIMLIMILSHCTELSSLSRRSISFLAYSDKVIFLRKEMTINGWYTFMHYELKVHIFSYEHARFR
jgi:hypothetical protein